MRCDREITYLGHVGLLSLFRVFDGGGGDELFYAM